MLLRREKHAQADQQASDSSRRSRDGISSSPAAALGAAARSPGNARSDGRRTRARTASGKPARFERREREKAPDPNSPFAKLAALKAQLEADAKERR